MLLPIGTDAPIYHRPIATGGLIAANIVTFIHTDFGAAADGWLLTFGNGLHPSEWLKSAFLHLGFGHLVGNMLFLWIFGLIVEGKLGAARFLLLYFVVCLLDGFLCQLLMLNYSGLSQGAGGASGVIFALMAMAWIWAPKNCIEFLFLLFIVYMGTFEVSLQTVALFYIGADLLSGLLTGFQMSTPVLHLLGAGVGVAVGLVMLKKDWVDCEGWDLLSLRSKDHPSRGYSPSFERPERKRPKWREKTERERPSSAEIPPQIRLRQIERLIDAEEFEKAFSAYEALRHSPVPQFLPQQKLEKLLKGMVRLSHWNAAAALLKERLERFDDDPLKHRLALASILTRQLQRPRAAIKVLKQISRGDLDQRAAQRYQQILKEARKQIDDGVLEVEGS